MRKSRIIGVFLSGYCGVAFAAAPPTGTAPPVPARDSLLEFVPGHAAAALIVRKNTLAPLRDYFARHPEAQKELGAYLDRVIGVDFTRVEGAAVYTTSLSNKPVAAAFLRIPGALALKRPAVKTVSGVALVDVGNGGVAAVVPGGLLIGAPSQVEAGIARIKDKQDPLGPDSPLAAALDNDGRDVDLLFALDAGSVSDPSFIQMTRQLGIRNAALTWAADGLITLTVGGDPAKLGPSRDLLMQLLGVGLRTLEDRKNQAMLGNDVGEATGAILAYHQVAAMVRELEPKVSGNKLISRYQLPKLEGNSAIIPYLGTLAAIAIPNFMTYLRKAKTSEARIELSRLRTSVMLHRERHGKLGKRFTFPASTPWAPEKACCGQPGDKCPADPAAFGHPTWKALEFTIAEPHYFQYRYTSEGKGNKAHFTIEARADLDCDGHYSSFRVEGGLDEKGELHVDDLMTSDELE